METTYYTNFKVLTGNFWIALTDEGIIQASIHSTEEQFMKDLKEESKVPMSMLQKNLQNYKLN